MTYASRTSSLAFGIIASLLLNGCTTVTTQSFRNVKDSEIESSQIAVGADFGKFDRLMADDMGIFFPQHATPGEDEQRRTRQIFRSAFLGQLEGYSIVNKPGPSTLLVRPSLIDYRHSSGDDAMQVRSDLRDVAKPGSLIFLMELVDSETNEVLGRAADSATIDSFAIGGASGDDWSAVESAADRWAGLFRQFLDENIAK